jgi:glutamate-1-semialdehyde 2,1-aminomutase
MISESKYAKSAAYYESAKRYLPGGVSSNFRLGMKPYPLFFERGTGSRLTDVDGNEYVDYVLGMGPVILGHAHPEVNNAVSSVLDRGQLFAGQHTAELELAREICSLIPCAEMVRFSLSGSEVVQAALRAARAHTGRNRIVKFEGQYHGWFDNVFVSVNPAAKNAPPNSTLPVAESLGQDPNAFASDLILPWNDFDALKSVLEDGHDIAAVIMEPIMCNTAVIPPKPGYLEKVRELCTTRKIVLIFDEVITGFRIGLRGAQKFVGVTPDLALFAKAMGNGYPISCVAGRREIMEQFGSKPVVHGGTFNTNLVSSAAALATVHQLRDHEDELYGKIKRVGSMLMDGLRTIAKELDCPLIVQGFPSVFHTTFGNIGEITDYRSNQKCMLDKRTEFVDLLLLEGIRVTSRGTWFLSSAHTEADVEETLRAARAAMIKIMAKIDAAKTPA